MIGLNVISFYNLNHFRFDPLSAYTGLNDFL